MDFLFLDHIKTNQIQFLDHIKTNQIQFLDLLDSELRYNFQWCLGEYMWCSGLNRGWYVQGKCPAFCTISWAPTILYFIYFSFYLLFSSLYNVSSSWGMYLFHSLSDSRSSSRLNSDHQGKLYLRQVLTSCAISQDLQ